MRISDWSSDVCSSDLGLIEQCRLGEKMDKITPASRCAMDKHHHRASGFANADVCQAGSVGLQALMAHADPIAHMRGKVSIALAARAGRDADTRTTGTNPQQQREQTGKPHARNKY